MRVVICPVVGSGTGNCKWGEGERMSFLRSKDLLFYDGFLVYDISCDASRAKMIYDLVKNMEGKLLSFSSVN